MDYLVALNNDLGYKNCQVLFSALGLQSLFYTLQQAYQVNYSTIHLFQDGFPDWGFFFNQVKAQLKIEENNISRWQRTKFEKMSGTWAVADSCSCGNLDLFLLDLFCWEGGGPGWLWWRSSWCCWWWPKLCWLWLFNAFGVVNKSDENEDCSVCGYNADDCRLLMCWSWLIKNGWEGQFWK